MTRIRSVMPAVVVGLILVGCGRVASSAAPSTVPSVVDGSSGPTSSPTLAPMTEAPRPTETPMPKVQLGYGARVEIDDDADLHMRPATASSVIGSVHAGPVEIEIMDDDTVSPMLGPVEADGLIWYPVRSSEGPFGWLGLDESTWEPMAPDCPTSTSPSVEEFLSMAPAERVACFGDQPMSFTAAVALSGLGGLSLASFEPDWLASRLTTNMRVSSASGVTLSAPLHLAPGLSLARSPSGIGEPLRAPGPRGPRR